MTITETALGTNHPSYSTNLSSLAGLLEERVRTRLSSYALLTLTLLIHIGQGSTDTVVRLALWPQERCDEAEPLYRRAMAITESTLGTDHPTYTIRLNNLAGLLQDQVRAMVSTPALIN